jgi:hypothetical protein
LSEGKGKEKGKEEVKKALDRLKGQPVSFESTKGQSNIADELTIQFEKIILPAWALFIFLESGLVSLLLGLEFYFNAPFILIIGGFAQFLPASFLILRKLKHGKQKPISGR